MVTANQPPAWAVRSAADRLALEEGCYWDDAKGLEIVRFAHAFARPKYIKGTFRLLDWQQEYLRSCYSWRNEDGTRRFLTTNLHISKKAGKTLISAVLLLYEQLFSEHQSPFTASGSVSRLNASQIYAELKYSLMNNGFKNLVRFRDTQKSFEIPALGSEHRSLAASGEMSEGLNLTGCVLDEVHAMRSDKLYKTLRYACSDRNGLLSYISTAGDDPTHFYATEIYQKSKNVLNGTDLDTTHLAYVYEADPKADLVNDKRQWFAANPGLGRTTNLKKFERELNSASKTPPAWNNFKRYRLNIFTAAEDSIFCTLATFDACAVGQPEVISVKEDELMAAPCVLGFDGSQTTDPTALSAVWKLTDGRYFVRSWAWVAEAGAKFREAGNLPKYSQFPTMTITPGRIIDQDLIREKIDELARQYRVQSIVLDPNMAGVFMGNLEADGFQCYRQSNTHAYFSPAMKWFGALLVDKKIVHEGDPWLRYNFANLRVDTNHKNEIRPTKKNDSSPDHIDGAVATFQAFGMAAQLNEGTPDTTMETW